jgi:hypothetical protein
VVLPNQYLIEVVMFRKEEVQVREDVDVAEQSSRQVT